MYLEELASFYREENSENLIDFESREYLALQEEKGMDALFYNPLSEKHRIFTKEDLIILLKSFPEVRNFYPHYYPLQKLFFELPEESSEATFTEIKLNLF